MANKSCGRGAVPTCHALLSWLSASQVMAHGCLPGLELCAKEDSLLLVLLLLKT